jgi:hypothetical protein
MFHVVCSSKSTNQPSLPKGSETVLVAALILHERENDEHDVRIRRRQRPAQ